MLIFSLTAFLSALLLFQVELIIGKYILPWFGGSSAVWITCMLFFQTVLLGGYAYGHLLDRGSARAQTRLHRLLLVASLLVLAGQFLVWHSPLTLDSSWKPRTHADPLLQVLVLLAVSAGLPYLVLASTAPLLQSWWRRLYPQRSPYRLYAVSNFGSFLGLVSYPFLVEPFLTLKTQACLWTFAYGAFVLGCGYCAVRAASAPEPAAERAPDVALATQDAARDSATDFDSEPAAPTKGLRLLWLSLAACASAMFLATTNQVCKNVAAVPLLWVLPLALYLLSFTLCFESDRWYSRTWFHPAFALGVFLVCFVLSTGEGKNLLAQVAIYSFALFAGCMVCHGELARIKPHPRYLTLFYLIVAGGGVLGGIFVALLAPRWFAGYWEYQVSLWFAALLLLVTLFRDKTSWLFSTRVKSSLVLVGAAALLPESMALAVGSRQLLGTLPSVVVILGALFFLQGKQKAAGGKMRSVMTVASCTIVLLVLAAEFVTLGKASEGKIAAVRNFYGALTVDDRNAADPAWEAYALRHGDVVHGFQFRAESKRRIPTSYFTEESGLGIAFAQRAQIAASAATPGQLRADDIGLSIGDIGLGIGTVAAYGRAGDTIRFYELNPEVVRLASDPRYFSYLADSPAHIDLILGDGRLSLESELAQGARENFDVLIVDAFNGDAVPVHLLTQEAFELYLRHLKPGGILAVQVTNTFLDLRPVVVAAAEHFALPSVWVHAEKNEHTGYENDWVLISRNAGLIDAIAARARQASKMQVPERRLWTDDYSNLFQALR
jgi:hypothetical protein